MHVSKTNRLVNSLLIALGVAAALAVVVTGVYGLRNGRGASADPHAGHAHAAGGQEEGHAAHGAEEAARAREDGDVCCPGEAEHTDIEHTAHEGPGDACCPGEAEHADAEHAPHEGPGDACCPSESEHVDAERDPNRGWCGEHSLYEDECAICAPARTALLEPGQSMKLRLPAPDVLKKAGVVIAEASQGTAKAETPVLCKVTYNEGQLAHITPLVSGSIRKVLADVGDAVPEGAALVELSSPEVADAKGAYLSALAEERLAAVTHKREKGLWEKHISPAQDYEQASAALAKAQTRVRTAHQSLLNVGLGSDEIRTVRDSQDTSSVVVMRAPFAGTLVERHAVIGETVDRGALLFMLADLSNMWVELAVPSALFGALHLGDSVQAEFEGLEGVTFDGEIDWVDTRVDEGNRTLRARAVVSNDAGRLKHGMFGSVRIASASAQPAVLVPSDAVQQFEGAPVVFVKLGEDLFDVRRVTLGPNKRDHVAVLAGVEPGEEIVVARSFTVKSEFLKERLGAGCTEH
ncbi:MAG: efflux RND transporter periplasmic adaptor subunit [bacterium]|nr:efflux RND transporter periplasmic adaptor subunit [bacterium]